jgi:hypothetical protein
MLVEMKRSRRHGLRLSQDKHWYCPRGLEGSERKERVRHLAEESVLGQQELQKEGSYTPDLMAQVNNNVTCRCHVPARLLGVRDQEEMIR